MSINITIRLNASAPEEVCVEATDEVEAVGNDTDIVLLGDEHIGAVQGVAMSQRIIPVCARLFGDPLPSGHPWASTSSPRSGWDVGALRAHILREEGGCTLCRRGLPRCVGVKMRTTMDFLRATCARCIKTAMYAFDSAAVAEVVGGKRGNHRELSETKLATAIGWWRLCGADPGAHVPYWLARFFAADADVGESRVSP